MSKLAYKNMLESNWDEIKGTVQEKWSDLTKSDMEKIGGSYQKLTAKLSKLYGQTTQEIEEELAEFLSEGKFSSMKQAATKKINEIKEVVSSFIQDNYQATKEKAQEAEKAVIGYVRQNPYKSVGIAAAAGFLLSYLAKDRS